MEIKPGWYRMMVNGEIVRVVGASVSPNMAIIEARCIGGHRAGYEEIDDLIHLPSCTGFDWKPEPKYVPFTRETIPRDAWYRLPSGCDARISRLSDTDVYFSCAVYNYKNLLEVCTIDGKPAGRLE